MLTDRQQRFVSEYMKDCDGQAAYLRAGYKTNAAAAKVNAHRLLRKPEISAAIAAKQAEIAQQCSVSAQDVIRELHRLAFADIGQVLDFSGPTIKLRPGDQITEDARRTLSSVKVRRQTEGTGDDALDVEVTEFRLCDKLGALEKLGRHLGLFKPAEAQPVTVNVENKIKVDARTLFADIEEYLPVFQKIAEEKLRIREAANQPPELEAA